MNPILVGSGYGLILAIMGLTFGWAGFFVTLLLTGLGAAIGWAYQSLDLQALRAALHTKRNTRSD